MKPSLNDSLADWMAGRPLPEDVLKWAYSAQTGEKLIATHRTKEAETMLRVEQRRDGQVLFLEKTSSEGRALISIILQNGMIIQRSFDLTENRILHELTITDPNGGVLTGPFEIAQATTHDLSLSRIAKTLRIDCSTEVARGDVLIIAPAEGLSGYYSFERIPTELVTRNIVAGNAEPAVKTRFGVLPALPPKKLVIGETPHNTVHLWDYLTGQPLSVYLGKAYIVGSLAGGIGVHAPLSKSSLAVYQAIHAAKSEEIAARYSKH